MRPKEPEMRSICTIALTISLASAAMAQEWELVGDGADHRGWRLAMREVPDCKDDLGRLVESYLGGPDGVAEAGIDLAEVPTKDIFDIMIDGVRSGSVACMGTLQTLAGPNERIVAFTSADQ